MKKLRSRLLKIKELPTDMDLVGLELCISRKKQLEYGLPDAKMMIMSGWNKGFWLKRIGGETTRIYPYHFETVEEVMELTVDVSKTYHLLKQVVAKFKEKK